MTIKEKAQDIHDMMLQGKLLEAFDKYYHEDVVMTEPRGTRKGKQECRNYEEQFLESIKEFHGLEVKAIASDEDKGTAFIQSSMDVTFEGTDDKVTMEQVSVQQWKDGQVIHERFFYNNEG